jgi:hypothetical protein
MFLICSIKVFKDTTMFFLQGKPNINSVIPAMDYLDLQLTTSALDPKYSRAIKASVTLGKKTLNHYNDLTDSSDLYHIAMGPCQWIYSHWNF